MKSNFKLCARQRHMDGVTKRDWSKIGRNIKRTIKTGYLVRRRFVEAKVQNTTDLLVPNSNGTI